MKQTEPHHAPAVEIQSTADTVGNDEAPAAQVPLTPAQLYDRTLRSVVLINNIKGDVSGTGWIVDVDRRWIVTNQHVVKSSDEVKLLFPAFKDGRPLVDGKDYPVNTFVTGDVVDSQKSLDLAIVQAKSLPEGCSALELASGSSSPGDRIHAIGGLPDGSAGLWKYSTGFVTQVSEGSGVGLEFRVMQSNIDIDKGNSGGPIVNDFGKVIAVAKSVSLLARNSSYNIDVDEVRNYLHEVLPLLSGGSADDQLQLGRRHLAEGRYRVARRHLTDSLRQQPDSSEAHAERGWTFLKTGDIDTAVVDLKKGAKLDSANSRAWLGLARAHRLLGDPKRALTDASSGIASSPEDAHLYNERAIIQEKLKGFDRARADLDRAVELAPKNAEFLSNRAGLLIQMERYAEARHDVDKALEFNDPESDLHPQHDLILNQLGVVQFRTGDLAGAAESFLEALKKNSRVVEYHFNMADTLQRMGEYEQSIVAWSRAIKLDGKNKRYFHGRAISFLELGKLKNALADANRACELDDKYAAAFHLRGKIKEQLGNVQAAQSDFQLAAQLDPKNYGLTPETAKAKVEAKNTESVSFHAKPVIGGLPVGRWYANGTANGTQYEMTQLIGQDATYQLDLRVTANGATKRIEEQGSVAIEGDTLRFNTNLGSYTRKFQMQDGRFRLYFADLNVWLISTQQGGDSAGSTQPEPNSPKENSTALNIRQTIEHAISQGAPLYNAGDADGCANIYVKTIETLLAADGHGMPPSLEEKLRTSLNQARQTSWANERAWILRYALDSADATLSRLP